MYEKKGNPTFASSCALDMEFIGNFLHSNKIIPVSFLYHYIKENNQIQIQ
jgi:hypothetical protein